MRLIHLLLCLMVSASASASASAEPKISVQMRDTGYTLGDVMEAHAVIHLDQGQHIAPGSLPPLGRITHWLELRTATLEQSGSVARLDLCWQVFATVETARMLKVPAIELHTDGDKPQTVVIPAQSFILSPVLPHPLENTRPRPNLPPWKFDEHTPLQAALACLGFALACLTFWLWLVDRLPGLPRRPGPFTRLARRLRRHKGTLNTEDLRELHAAFNAAAGETLYPATLPRLFERAPHLAPVRAEIEQFFQASWQCFFASGADIPERTQALNWVMQAARAERLVRR